jgi:hypothetical protein
MNEHVEGWRNSASTGSSVVDVYTIEEILLAIDIVNDSWQRVPISLSLTSFKHIG